MAEKARPAPASGLKKRGENARLPHAPLPNLPPEGRRFGPGNQAAKGFGRPKSNAEMRELCRDETGTVITKWKVILLRSNGAAAVRAGELLMAYAWGKPNQPIVGANDGPIAVRAVLTSDERRARLRELAQKAVTLAAAEIAAKEDGGTGNDDPGSAD